MVLKVTLEDIQESLRRKNSGIYQASHDCPIALAGQRQISKTFTWGYTSGSYTNDNRGHLFYGDSMRFVSEFDLGNAVEPIDLTISEQNSSVG